MSCAYVVYWQPGCSSCLRAKEFLSRHGVAFDSVNVRLDAGAAQRLAALGARSIPVIARGNDWVYGQDIDEVAAFLGIEHERAVLPPALLADRIERLLAAAARYTGQLPPASLEKLLPGRSDRAAIDLAYHIAMILRGFLDAARGGCLHFEYFERRPTAAQRGRSAVMHTQQLAAQALAAWWRESAALLPAEVNTYYGTKPLTGVFERTAWHIAQHVRQLESLVSAAGIPPDGALGDSELGGLPLPDGLWDREIGAP
jgi:glutaredoxin